MEIKRVRYNGQEFSLKGGNDRFVLPPDFRRTVKEASHGQRTLCLQTHASLPCLIGFGLASKDELDEQIEREEARAIRDGQPFNRQIRYSELFGFSEVPFDESGRFVLPPRFIKHGKISDSLYFHGAGPEILIFNPEELMGLGDEWRHVKAACEDCMDMAKPGKRRK
ncbi:MAG: division/cell wall cluster transcriptional repressor MraZ [Novosphingobium sp.]